MNILHITYDLRDRHNREKTTAVKRLIDCSNTFADVSVIDIVRVASFKAEKTEFRTPDHLIINSFGLPYGLFFNLMQNRAFKKIIKAIKQGQFEIEKADLIHSHKLTFDGYIGYKLAKLYNKPFVISLRQTDVAVLRMKYFLRKSFKKIIIYSKGMIYLIPQMLVEMEKLYGMSFFDKYIRPKSILMPNVINREKNSTGLSVEERTFLTILIMDRRIIRRKNIKRLLKAFKLLMDKNLKLQIIGDGNSRYKIEKWIDKLGLRNNVELLGRIDNDKIDKYYARAEAFLLPSLSESFGMVYAEALQNGTPILYSKGYLGFDGFFENVGVGVNPKSIEAIKNGILDLLINGNKYRKQINILMKSGEFNIFNSDYITKRYQSVVTDCIQSN